ncbi:MAG TPA: phospholipase [Actinomycetota bacterium]|nr:phospholipase [Actinomycetota bacterium]
MTLQARVREVDDPIGMLVLIHGRGADENDLFPLFDILDPDGRLVGVCPRGPLELPPGGAHWYVVREVGYPGPETFFPTFERASRWLDETVAQYGLGFDSVILGGFSQGCVMTYALAFAAGRPAPAGVLALSGFIPTVEGFELDLTKETRVAIGHGTYDPIIEVGWGRDAHRRLSEAGADVTYTEYPLPHAIDPGYAQELQVWIKTLLEERGPGPR